MHPSSSNRKAYLPRGKSKKRMVLEDADGDNLLVLAVSESFGISSFQKMLKGNHMKPYDELQIQYYSTKSLVKKAGCDLVLNEFPKFADTNGYGGFSRPRST